MKQIYGIIMLLAAHGAMADGPCGALSNYVGTYKQVSKTCDDHFHMLGTSLEVKPYTEKAYSGYWINTSWSGGSMGYGPTTSDTVGDIDKCTVSGNDVLVQISENDKSGIFLPHRGRISYNFTPGAVAFTADGCTGTYTKN